MEPAYVTNSGLIVENVPKVGRKLRKPVHNFNVKFNPFVIQPFMIAPVLPGDTMKNLLMQARVVTDPIKHPLMGWWHETYFFYVKLRDLADRPALEAMLMANGPAPAATAASPDDYYSGEGVNFVKKCLDRVVETYFRSEEEVQSGLVLDANRTRNGRPLAKLITQPGWMENLKTDSDVSASDGTPLPGDIFAPIPEQYVGTPFEAAYTQWKEMQHLEMTAPTFEDYLKSFGVRPPAAIREEKHVPELLRYTRNWKQPTNTVGETGQMNSQVVWDVSERADKDRFFAEPGFILGVTTTRAKMYSSAQKGNIASFLNDAYAWLPALLRPDPFTSLKKFAFAGTGPLDGYTEDYWVDLADVFCGGDQFINWDLAASDQNLQGKPHETGNAIDVLLDYVGGPSVDGLFVTPATKNFVKMEGRVDLSILSAVVDTTP